MTEEERREAHNSVTLQHQQEEEEEEQEEEEEVEEEERGEGVSEKGNVLRAVLCLLPELSQEELRVIRETSRKMMTN